MIPTDSLHTRKASKEFQLKTRWKTVFLDFKFQGFRTFFIDVKAAGWDVWPRCTPAPWSNSRPPCTFPPQLPQVRFNKHVFWRDFNWIYFGFVLNITSQILSFLLFFLFQRWRSPACQTCKRGDGACWVVEVKISKSGFEKNLLKTSSCNMFFSPNLTNITAQYKGQMICS